MTQEEQQLQNEVQEGPLCIGDKVEVQLKNKTSVGELKFIGRIKGKPKVFYGVELRRQEGKNSGGLEGQDYFPCAQQRGVFVSRNKILRYKPADGQEDSLRVTIGDVVDVVSLGTGTIRYMGYPQFCDGLRFGIELDKPNGRFNGTVEGVYYFNARNLFGAFAEWKDLRKLEDGYGDEVEQSVEPPMQDEKESEAMAEENTNGVVEENSESQIAAEQKDDGQDSPVVEQKQVETEQQLQLEQASVVVMDTSNCFIPALRDDSLLSFMIRQPNGKLNKALFDMYCGEGGTILKSAFEDVRNCAPANQLKILCRLLERFLGGDVPDFSSTLSITPYGCGVNGMYDTQEAFESGLEGAYNDLLAVKDEDPLKPTIPSSYIRFLPVSSVPESTQNNLVSLDELLDSANTGDFILFGGTSGLNRLMGHFTNTAYTQCALIVKGAIVADDTTYSAEGSISLLVGCTSAYSQMCDGIIDESLPFSVAAAEAVSYFQEKKFGEEFGVYFKLESEDEEMLSDIRQKIIAFAAGSVGCSFAPSRDGFPPMIQEVLTAMYGNRDPQASFFPSSGLLASAFQECGLMSDSKKAQSFVAGSFDPSGGSRIGYANGPFPHVSRLLYDGVKIQAGAVIDFATLPA